MAKELLIGIQEAGVMHTVWNEFDLDTRFRMVKESEVFDYYDKTPTPYDAPQFKRAVQKYGLPLTAGGWFYMLGRDEPLLQWHLQVAREYGTRVHNVQIFTDNLERRPVTDREVADTYLWAAEIGDKWGVAPCFEVHVNMWSEHFGRVERVAQLVKARGVAFNMTLDHSHVIFKMDNPVEQDVQGMRSDIESGQLELDPFREGNVCQRWIDSNYVRHAHARAAVPNGPVNVWSLVDGKPGRGIQYPFLQTKSGEWHTEWDGTKLEPWKEVIRQLLRHHAVDPASKLATISTEFIPWPDYGAAAKYSLFENSVACANWIREEWNNVQSSAASGARP